MDWNTITIFQWATLSIASLGAVLGILNTKKSFDRDRIRLVVTPRRVINDVLTSDSPLPPEQKDSFQLAIEIANLSSFAVTVDQVGLILKGSSNRAAINPELTDAGPWPRRLDSHSSVTVRCDLRRSEISDRIQCAFAETQSGQMFRGNSLALTDLSERFLKMSEAEKQEVETAHFRRSENARRRID